ncbi:hypothetical protein ACPC37_11215 [Streptomyces griseoincarnatus]
MGHGARAGVPTALHGARLTSAYCRAGLVGAGPVGLATVAVPRSVSRRCAQYAACPVVVVGQDDDPRR